MNKKKFNLITILQWLMTLVFIGSLGFAIFYVIDNQQSQKKLENLSQEMNDARLHMTKSQQPASPSQKQTEFPMLQTLETTGLVLTIPPGVSDETNTQDEIINKDTIVSDHQAAGGLNSPPAQELVLPAYDLQPLPASQPQQITSENPKTQTKEAAANAAALLADQTPNNTQDSPVLQTSPTTQSTIAIATISPQPNNAKAPETPQGATTASPAQIPSTMQPPPRQAIKLPQKAQDPDTQSAAMAPETPQAANTAPPAQIPSTMQPSPEQALKPSQKAQNPDTQSAAMAQSAEIVQDAAPTLPPQTQSEASRATILPPEIKQTDNLPQSLPSASPSPAPNVQPNPILTAYRNLHARNPDLAGWINIHDTIVDYPVMYTPDDPEKYLHLDFEGDYSLAGLPFLDVSYPPDSQGVNQLIYAHNMKSGQMFAILHQFYKDEVWDKYRTLSFDTLDSQREYEILALIPVILGPMDKPSMMIFHSLNTLSEQSVDEINAYLQHYSKRLAGDVELGDDLVTLVTCRKLSDSDRLLVVARRGADQNRP